MRGRRRALCGLLTLLAACLPALAGVKITLRDGRVLEGREIDREETLYLLELESGAVLSLPDSLVIRVDLVDDEEPLPGGLTPAEPQTLAGLPDGASLPTLSEQLRVLRESSAQFRAGVIDPFWTPTSDWADTPEINNNFNPARWYRPPIDPNWVPVNSLGKDVTNFNPVRWYQAPIDPTWWPTDGFAKRDR